MRGWNCVRVTRPDVRTTPEPAGRYPLAVARAAATCLVALLVVGSPWAVCRRTASAARPDDALRQAVAAGDLQAIERAVNAGARVDGRDRSGMSPLANAITCEQPEAVRWLLARGADVNGTVGVGVPPLFLALTRPALAAVLLECGADVHARTANGTAPLLAACCWGNEDTVLLVVNLLLQAGADVNAGSARGERPLGTAAESGHARVVRRLLDAGADVNLADDAGATPLMLAARGGHPKVIAMLRQAGAAPAAGDQDALRTFTPPALTPGRPPLPGFHPKRGRRASRE
jgi:uncharacterized protein